jgi:hypothetical protein
MSARWHCLSCGLSTAPTRGTAAAREIALLAGIHDQVHHRGALTARVVVSDADQLTAQPELHATAS